MPLITDGPFYLAVTDSPLFSDEDHACVRDTVARLQSVETSAARPGMLLGKIQSGKTKTFLGTIALAFDNDFDIAIILTKGTKALTAQTLRRVRRDFARVPEDSLQIYDILTVPSGLTGYELRQKLIFVAKKQSDNLDRLATLLREAYPQLASRRALIIDDEADYASVGYRGQGGNGTTANVTTQQIDELRSILVASAVLQVTATPYALYLQPETVLISGNEFKPVRPAFTKLVPVHPDYIGSEYYFGEPRPDSVSDLLYHPVTIGELTALKQPDRRRFKIEECLTSPAIHALRTAVCSFIVGGTIRRLQSGGATDGSKKFSFLVHTEAGRAAHAWQETVVLRLADELARAVDSSPGVLRALLKSSYDDLSASIQRLHHELPDVEQVIAACFEALRLGYVMVQKVNSERQVEELLDDDGQLKLRTPLNIFIGGQILDRGITVANLIGFFYGRRPQIFQQDTVLQHSRMFGFRPREDIAVTRFYTEPQIYDAMRRMHECDVALREEISRNPDSPIVFVQRDQLGGIIPCSPSKTFISQTTTLRPGKRILPVGFQTTTRGELRRATEKIDRDLTVDRGDVAPREPFLVSLARAIDILNEIEPTLVMDEDGGYKFDWDVARATLTYLSLATDRPEAHSKVWILVRDNRDLSRLQGSGAYQDAPDTDQREGVVARRVATDAPMLMLFRQNGAEELGWRGAPFYWPLIWAPNSTRTAIFSHLMPR